MPPPTCEDTTPLKGLDRSEREGGVVTLLAQDCWTIRLMERHVTGYPSCVNYEVLPRHARPPCAAGVINKRSKPIHPPKKDSLSLPPSILRTTNQIADDLTKMGLAMRLETEKNKMRGKKLETDGSRDPTMVLTPIGFRMGLLAPPYDVRSTYRHDYSGEVDGVGLGKNIWKKYLENYRKKWNSEDASDVDRAMQIPYLTVPERICSLRPTMYRSDYMPRISRNDLRTLPHQVNLPSIGNTYAYSAYTTDDPRRDVPFDPDVASITDLRNVLYETYSPHSYSAEKGVDKRSLREYLGQLRESMLHAHQGCAGSKHVKESPYNESVFKLTRTVVVPGTNGCPSQCIPLDPENYIMLPQDHFGHRPVYDY
ncbi:unnamed protein product [Phytomonas sp. EM1]|nr:unnamed protein product [Phytomonas sp. EM1]|eukprot:CCW60115.1 unnamed protein product [Phytomonas sp. isolate EM1]